MPNAVYKSRGFTEMRAVFANEPRRVQDIGRVWLLHVAAVETVIIQAEAPARSGKFKNTIVPYARSWQAGVQFLPYPGLGLKLRDWIVQGTGIYGPRHHVIVPVHARALRFAAGGQTLFRASVSGMKPNDFIARGVRKFDPQVAQLVKELKYQVVADFKAQIKRQR